MTPSLARNSARELLLARFRWQDGHADVWSVFRDPVAFAAVIRGLAEPWRSAGITHVLGVEARGFLLGGAVAVELGAGFHAVRKGDGLLPGAKHVIEADEDYRGRRHRLRTQATLRGGQVVLLVDDWAERGSQATAARRLVEASGAAFAGVSLMGDQLPGEVRSGLGRATSLVKAEELGDSSVGSTR